MEDICEAIFNNFASHFQLGSTNRSGIDNLTFNSLNFHQGGDLIRPFNHEEVKQTVLISLSSMNLGLTSRIIL